jgi:hypothetical protein
VEFNLLVIRVLEFWHFIDLFIKRNIEKPKKNKLFLRENEFINFDWIIIQRIAGFLQPFYDLTVRFQSYAANANYGLL